VTAFGRPPGTNGTLAHGPLMAGKSVLVTGDTGGIGKTAATGLAALGARVGITGRDPARFHAAAESIRAAAVTSRAVTFRGNGQPAGDLRGAPAGTHLTGLSPTA
jgi:NAD(P)-dependent dehydrogenase (short-subunit alcohol dehydrogenase family)